MKQLKDFLIRHFSLLRKIYFAALPLCILTIGALLILGAQEVFTDQSNLRSQIFELKMRTYFSQMEYDFDDLISNRYQYFSLRAYSLTFKRMDTRNNIDQYRFELTNHYATPRYDMEIAVMLGVDNVTTDSISHVDLDPKTNDDRWLIKIPFLAAGGNTPIIVPVSEVTKKQLDVVYHDIVKKSPKARLRNILSFTVIDEHIRR